MRDFEDFEGLDIRFTGPPEEEGPLPALFYFSLSAEESLTLDPYNQFVRFLGNERQRIFSVTLPGHGPGYDKFRAMSHWAEHPEELSLFFSKLFRLIDHLEEKKWMTGPFICSGLSRGGFVALRLASHPKAGACIAFAPVIDLAYLEEFRNPSLSAFIRELSVTNILPLLIRKKIKIFIGNDDTRVGSDPSYAFLRELISQAKEAGQRSFPFELSFHPSTGHQGHGTLPHIFKEGAEKVKKWIVE